jgi:hypothetical protein
MDWAAGFQKVMRSSESIMTRASWLAWLMARMRLSLP